ncbi:hypothetical protein H8S90_15575 [Olivibacter sp. SDN3]|uniref:SGNH/GDSL hydrolase family protein n=1 Tax=Olivibacter sp. SDN3 TaxID=2764720 RepID=UPI00165139CC|nr:SGNH/GDSL hydrolase family protein [Olivibacter sp. SDN3]QNL48216.1 hypothetical protein H8S90_15575 [Olivibacter sp. SDN3]
MQENLIQEQWDEEISLIKKRTAKLKHSNDLVAFYGSSSFRLWANMKDDLCPLHTLNMGFGGSTYKDCLYYFDTVFAGVYPKNIVLYGGDNDIANGETPTAILNSFKALVNKIQGKYPNQALAVISIKPSLSRLHLLPDIIRTNNMLQQSINRIGGSYIDVFSLMLNNKKQPRKELFLEDDLHMNAQGYRIWAETLLDYFKGI